MNKKIDGEDLCNLVYRKKEIEKYPFNARIEDEIEIFISDQICEQIVIISYRNGQIFCTIKDKLTKKRKEIVLAAVLFGSALFGMAKEARPMGVPQRIPPAYEIHSINLLDHQPVHQYAPIVIPRLDKIRLMATHQLIPLIYINGHHAYINEQLLKRIRSGDLAANLAVVAIGVVVYIMFQLQGIDAFGIIASWNAPQAGPSFGAAPSSTEIALVSPRAQEFNDMLLEFNEAKSKVNFIMTKDEALKLISKTYPGQLEITANERISDWQAAKKIYHASEFGINPEDYGMTKDNILRIQSIGLTKYVREGRPLPPIKLIKAYQMAVKNMCDNSKQSDGKFSSRAEQKIHQTTYSYNKITRQIAGFNKKTGDLITAGKYSPRAFDRFLDTKHLGRL